MNRLLPSVPANIVEIDGNFLNEENLWGGDSGGGLMTNKCKRRCNIQAFRSILYFMNEYNEFTTKLARIIKSP